MSANFSDILDGSSFTFSSPASRNPYGDPRTPTRRQTQEQVTPSSLVRTLFARPRDSPVTTPSQARSAVRGGSPLKHKSPVIVLSQPKKSFTTPTPSPFFPASSSPPEPPSPTPAPNRRSEAGSSDREGTPTPTPTHAPPPAQPQPTLTTSTGQKRRWTPSALVTPGPAGRFQKRTRLSSAGRSDLADANTLGFTPFKSALHGSTPARPSLLPILQPTPPPPSFGPRPSPARPSNESSNLGYDLAAWQFAPLPPTLRDVVGTFEAYGLDAVEYVDPYYSNPADVPPKPKQFAGRRFLLKSNTAADLPEFESELGTATPWLKTKRLQLTRAEAGWEYIPSPSSWRAVSAYCEEEDRKRNAPSQLVRPTQKNKYGFKFSQKKSERKHLNMSVLCLEVFGGYGQEESAALTVSPVPAAAAARPGEGRDHRGVLLSPERRSCTCRHDPAWRLSRGVCRR